MARRTLAKRSTGLSTPRKPRKKDMKEWHNHGCSECGKRYSDTGGCFTGGENGRCQECRLGRSRPIWDQHADPVECCPGNQRPVTEPGELLTYNLGGSAPWYICKTCKRAQIYLIRSS